MQMEQAFSPTFFKDISSFELAGLIGEVVGHNAARKVIFK